MLHHLSIGVSDLAKAEAFYAALLAPLGCFKVASGSGFVGFGNEEGKDKFTIKSRTETVKPPSAGFHIALSASSRNAVEAFHTAAIAHGATDNGQPGLRPHYGPDYYAAFIIDPDGYEIEVVINEPV